MGGDSSCGWTPKNATSVLIHGTPASSLCLCLPREGTGRRRAAKRQRGQWWTMPQWTGPGQCMPPTPGLRLQTSGRLVLRGGTEEPGWPVFARELLSYLISRENPGAQRPGGGRPLRAEGLRSPWAAGTQCGPLDGGGRAVSLPCLRARPAGPGQPSPCLGGHRFVVGAGGAGNSRSRAVKHPRAPHVGLGSCASPAPGPTAF